MFWDSKYVSVALCTAARPGQCIPTSKAKLVVKDVVKDGTRQERQIFWVCLAEARCRLKAP